MKLFKYMAVFGLTVSFGMLGACSSDVAGTTEDENSVIAEEQQSGGVDSTATDSPADPSTGNDKISSSGFVSPTSCAGATSPVTLESSGSLSANSGNYGDTGHPSTSGDNFATISSGSMDVAPFSSSVQGQSAAVDDDSSAVVPVPVGSSSSVQPSSSVGAPTEDRSDWVRGAWVGPGDSASAGVVGAVEPSAIDIGGGCFIGGPYSYSVTHPNGFTSVPGMTNQGGAGASNGFDQDIDLGDLTYCDAIADTLFDKRVKKLVKDGMTEAEAEKQAVADIYLFAKAGEVEALHKVKLTSYVVKRAVGYMVRSVNRYDHERVISSFVNDYYPEKDTLICDFSKTMDLKMLSVVAPKLVPQDCDVPESDVEEIRWILENIWAGCRDLPVCDAASEGTEMSTKTNWSLKDDVVCKDFSWTLKK